ncbi:hypothetical protein ACGFZB_25685 [Streptomyces cinerochromogenes]|uniref:Aminoglycoside phosphotransferase n=1 Tax=Streptomyces cinerochromogenes TaxID=66422 RepID=A0ABW7B9A4_9ACTN
MTVEEGGEFWGWAGRTLEAPARTAAGTAAWLRLVAVPEDKAFGKLWEGAWEAQHALGSLDGHRPALIGLHDATEDGTAYRAELSVRVDEPVLSTDPILQQDLDLPGQWWTDLAHPLHKLAATPTDRIAVRTQYMQRAIPQFLDIPAPEAPCWNTAHADLHWANLTTPLRILDWEGWGAAPAGFDAAMLYAYTLRCLATAARVRETFPALGRSETLAAEATVCAMLLQTVDRGDNLVLEYPLRMWAQEIRRRYP